MYIVNESEFIIHGVTNNLNLIQQSVPKSKPYLTQCMLANFLTPGFRNVFIWVDKQIILTRFNSS